MTDLSTVKEEQIVLVDKDTAIRYKVIEERIDLTALKTEREQLVAELAMKEPTKDELIELGKGTHPYFYNKEYAQQRIDQIDAILSGGK